MEINHSTDGLVLNNILSVDLDPRLDEQFASGIDFVDSISSASEDGFTPGFTSIFSGMPGAGKTTLCLQLADSFTGQASKGKKGVDVLYNTNEEAFTQVRKTCNRLKLQHGFAISSLSDIGEYLTELYNRQAVAEAAGREFVFFTDSLQTMSLGGRMGQAEQEMIVNMLTSFCKETYAVGIIICQSNKDGDFSGRNKIRHAVDGHLKIYFDKDKKSETFGSHILQYTKNRFGIAGTIIEVEVTKTGISQKIG